MVTSARRVAPGLLVVSVAAAVAGVIGSVTGVVSPLASCLLLGVLAGRGRAVMVHAGAGFGLARGVLLKLGVALLGFRLALDSVSSVGAVPLVSVVVVSAITFTAVRAAARRLGLSDGLGTLVGAGFAICGASAVVATAAVVDAEDEEIAFAAGLATVFGTISLFTLPLAAIALGLAPEQLGFWSGASVNDVGQAVASAAEGGAAALEVGVVTKLARVLLLAPLLVALRAGVRRPARDSGRAGRRPTILPWFIVAFLAAGVVRSAGVVPEAALDGVRLAESTLLGLGLVGVGAAVDLDAVHRAGTRPLALGALAWLVVVATGLAATFLTGAT